MTTEQEEMLFDENGNLIEAAPKVEENPPNTESASEGEENDAKLTQAADDEGHEDENAVDGESIEDAEARRLRNRERRAENKARRREQVETLRREIAARDELLAQQSARLDALERRSNGADMATVESELRKSVDAYNFFKQQHAEAVSTANGQLAAEAQEKMFTAMTRAQQLAKIREASKNPAQAQQQPLDPRIKANAEEWLARNSWYDPAGEDADSQITLTVDKQLHREGWNPTVPQYWEELDARLKKYLPHRYKAGYNGNQAKPRAPVAGSGREAGGKPSGGYRLSAERVNALKDAGIWDDPVKRADAIKRYQEFDKQQTA